MWGTAQPAPITHVLSHPAGKGGSEDPSWENPGVSTGLGTLLQASAACVQADPILFSITS